MKTVQLNTRGQYAVTAMIEIAKAKNARPLPLSEIAESTEISLSYLEQLIAGLRRHGLVKSYRGPGGGYILGKSPKNIMVADILHAAEDSTPARRASKKNTKNEARPRTRALWKYMGQLLSVTLSKITLHDILNGQLENHPHIRKIFELMDKSA